MTLLSIAGISLPEPTEYKVDREDIDSDKAGRSETGVMIRDRVRQGVYKISCAWKSLNDQELESIINACEPATFSMRFFDGSYRTKQFYAGARQTDLVKREGEAEAYWNLSVNFVEV